jgi:GntR family transcriptional regulator
VIFQIDPHSPKPVYRQLIDQVKYAVASGRLRVGERLPTIREVAVQTHTNRNTVARAYSDMEREGLITTRTGHGSFVSGEAPDQSRERSEEILAEKMDEILALAHQFRISDEDLTDLLKRRQKILKEPEESEEK